MKRIPENYKRDIDKFVKFDNWGRKSRIIYNREKIEKLGLAYKEGHAIKLKVSPDFINEPQKIREVSIINTYFYYRNLSPRVYDIGNVNINNSEYYYTDVELLEGETTNYRDIRAKVLYEGSKLEWLTGYDVDLDKKENYIGNKYVDFHGFEFDESKFYPWLVDLIHNRTHWGRKDNEKRFSYQDFDDVVGKRRIKERVYDLGLDLIDFKDCSVLDIGCNLGLMTNYALERGANRAVGIDLKEVIEAADLYKFYKGFKTELYHDELDSEKLKSYGEFDIVFFFAMTQSLGIPESLKEITKKVLIYEGHDGEDSSDTQKKLNRLFSRVEHCGYTNDRGTRPIFKCYKI